MRSINQLMLLGVLLSACNVESYEDKRAKENAVRETVEAEIQGKIDEAIKAFAQRYNADSTWKDGVKQQKQMSTYDFQKTLVRSDQRPVLASGSLFDIEKRGKEIVLLFHLTGYRRYILSEQYLLMELKCPLLSESDVAALKVKEFSAWDSNADYIIAAKIYEVSQAHQFLHAVDSERGPSSPAKVAIEYVAKGECVGIEYIGNFHDEYMEKVRSIPVAKSRR
jgi:hypothetical protein